MAFRTTPIAAMPKCIASMHDDARAHHDRARRSRGDKVIGAILFENTMDGEIEGQAGRRPTSGKNAASCHS